MKSKKQAVQALNCNASVDMKRRRHADSGEFKVL